MQGYDSLANARCQSGMLAPCIRPEANAARQPLTPPAVNPDCRFFCMSKNAIMVGIATIIDPAANSPHGTEVLRVKLYRATGIVWRPVGAGIKADAKTYSPQPARKP